MPKPADRCHAVHIPVRRTCGGFRGVEFLGETLDTGVCLMAFFYDPDGNVLILHRRYAPRYSRAAEVALALRGGSAG